VVLRRISFFIYGILAYGLTAATGLYLVGFVSDAYVPKSIDHGVAGSPSTPLTTAVVFNLALLLAFGFQHSLMARPWFKSRWCQVVPEPIERSTYVLATVGVLLLLFWQWRPIPDSIWDVKIVSLRVLIQGVSLSGWGLMLISSFFIDHFELFGVRQVTRALCNTPDREQQFVERGLYRWIRHPLMTGVLLAVWATPTMSCGHLLFALGMTVYIVIGVRWEEADLNASLGPDYAAYRGRTPRFFPWNVTGFVRSSGRSQGDH